MDTWSWVWWHRPVIPALTVETKASLSGSHPGIPREVLHPNKAATMTMGGKGIWTLLIGALGPLPHQVTTKV